MVTVNVAVSMTATRLDGPRATNAVVPSFVIVMPTGWTESNGTPGTLNVIVFSTLNDAASMTEHGATDFGRHPDLLAVGCELRVTWASVDEHVRHRLERAGVDEVRHVRRLRRGDRQRVIGRDGHAFRFDAHIHLLDDLPLIDVDYRGDRVVFVGDVKTFSIRRQANCSGSSPDGRSWINASLLVL